MKTNREIFMDDFVEKLQSSDTERFVDLVSAHGTLRRCKNCSNSYWDGNKASCHKNINKSDCIKGQIEYFESCPGEDLKRKYNKKYWYCDSHEQAQTLHDLMELIYTCGILEWDGVEACKNCHHKGKKCYSHEFKCYWPFQYLLDVYSDYIKEREKDLNEFDKLSFKDKMTFEVWIRDVIIPSISDEKICDKTKYLYELAYCEKSE